MKTIDSKEMLSIAVAGVPNCGKTTLFNSLTGSKQRIGNWPGVTVDKIEGEFQLGQRNVLLTDLPGTSDLNPDSEDQKVAQREIESNNYDWILNVVDATNLNQSLFLTLDLLQRTNKVIVLLNMIDLSEKEFISIDIPKLSEELGVPVFPIIARKDTSVKETFKEVEKVVNDANVADTKSYFPMDIENKFKAIDNIIYKVQSVKEHVSLTDKIDKVMLNKYFGVVIFFVIIFLTLWLSIGLGSVFIDFFDIISGMLFIDLPTMVLQSLNSPDWVITILAGGFGVGIQTIATFIPVIFFMFFGIAVLEDVGYMSRVAVIADRLLRKIGLPGNAFIPLIVGYGCTVPAVMAARTLKTKRERFVVIFMASFMSCGARLPVYALFAMAIFGSYAGLVVFSIYLFGFFTAIFTGFLLKNTLFKGKNSLFSINLPLYHKPKFLSITKRSYLKLKKFITKAGLIILVAVFVLNVFNLTSYENGKIKFNNEATSNSLLTRAGKSMSPIFEPMGIAESNWPATVALFTGLFAKEAIVGTINSLYTSMDATYVPQVEEESEEYSVGSILIEAVVSIKDNFVGSFDFLSLGLMTKDKSELKEELETDDVVFHQISSRFTFASGFAYLIFVLLYFPCLATLGAAKQEMGGFFAFMMTAYSTILAWITATLIYQVAEGHNIFYIGLSVLFMIVSYFVLYGLGKNESIKKSYQG